LNKQVFWNLYYWSRFGLELTKRLAWKVLCRPVHGYFGWLNRKNLGDEAIFEGIKHIRPDILWCDIPLRRRAFDLAIRLRLDGPKFFQTVVLGGGTLISQLPPFLQFTHRLLEMGQVMWCCGTGVGSVGWGQDPDPDLSEWKPALEQFKGIGVWGPRSKVRLEALNIRGVEATGDLALGLVLQKPVPPSDPPILGINFSLPVTGPEPFDIKGAFEKIIRIAQRRLKSGWRILPFVTKHYDLKPLKEFCNRLGLDPRIIIHWRRQPLDVINRLSRCLAVVGVRLHSVVLASCAGIPPISLGYREKCLDFMESMELEDRHIDLFTNDAEIIEERVESLLASIDELRALRSVILQRGQHWAGVQKEFIDRMISTTSG
jgi:hypothetical protein